MTNASGAFRTLVIYAVVLPLALIIGYLLATPMDLSTLATVALVFGTLAMPLLLKWHRPILFLTWNMSAIIFFLPGRPEAWLAAAFMSFLFCVLQRTLVRDMRFLSVPSLVAPLIYLAVVIVMTMRLTGGFGLASMGGTQVGGRRYLGMFGAIAGFLAMIAQRIPREKALLYVRLFFLGTLTDAIGSTVPYVSPSFYFLFWVFPVSDADISGLLLSGSLQEGVARFYGLSVAAMGGFYYLLARFGIRELLGWKHFKRSCLLVAALGLAAGGGFRNFLILMTLTFLLVFYFEGLLRSKYTVILVFLALLGGILLVPFANKLPLGIQRSLSFLPLDVDPVARASAEATTEWRLNVWKMALPEVPKYFWLGKGLGIDRGEFEEAGGAHAGNSMMSGEEAVILSGNYHSGPLSSIIPFGIWGLIGWVWFLAAGFRALNLNRIYGDPSLKSINTLLLAYYLAKLINFIFIFGSLYSELAVFAGVVGLGVALNGGICQPLRLPATARAVNLPIRRPLPAHG